MTNRAFWLFTCVGLSLALTLGNRQISAQESHFYPKSRPSNNLYDDMSASYDATKKDLVLLDRLLVNGLEARYHNPNDLMRLFQGKAKYLDKVKRKKDARPLPIPDRRLSSPETKQDLAGPTIVRPPDSDTKPAHSSQLTFDRDKPPGKKSPAAARSHEQLPAILPSMNSMASQLMLRSTRRSRTFDVPQIDCPSSDDGMERFSCPTADVAGRYRCIEDHVLCDGFIDCPRGEDEDRQACLFYKTTKAHLDVLADALLRWARGR